VILERKNANLEKELEKEQNEKITVIQEKMKLEKKTKNLKNNLRNCSHLYRLLQHQTKPLKLVAFLLQKLFTDEIDRKERKRPLVVNQDIPVMDEKTNPKLTPCVCHIGRMSRVRYASGRTR